MYFLRHILRFFLKTIPGFFRGLGRAHHELIVSVDHALSRKAALKALRRLHNHRKGQSLLGRIRIRKRLRLRPHGVRLELQLLPPWPQILAITGVLAPRMEDLLYYWQRLYRLEGQSMETGAAPLQITGTPFRQAEFPSFLEGDVLYFSSFFVCPHPDYSAEEEKDVYGTAYQGPDQLPFHLGRSHRILARVRSGWKAGIRASGMIHEIWQEALLFSGDRRYEGYLVQKSPCHARHIEFNGRQFEATLQNPASGSIMAPLQVQYQLAPMHGPFPDLPFDGKRILLFYVDATLRIHIYAAHLMDPVNHRLLMKGRPRPAEPSGWQRILNTPESEIDIPNSGTWVYTSSAVLERERMDTLDVLDCDYRNPDRQIRLKTSRQSQPIVYGRN